MKTIGEIYRTSTWFKSCVAVWTLMETFFLSGLTTGWPSLVYIFKVQGIYSDLCSPHGNHSGALNDTRKLSRGDVVNVTQCDAQDHVFVWSYTANIFISTAVGLLMGRINFIFGMRVLRITAMILGCIGCLCFAFISTAMPWLLFPGLFFLTSGGFALLMANIQISYMYKDSGSLVIAAVNGAMEVSCTVLLFVKILFEHGVSVSASFSILTVMEGMVLFSTFCFMPKHFARNELGTSTEVIDINDPDKAAYSVYRSDDNVSSGEDKRSKNEILKTFLKSPPFLLHTFWSCVCSLLFNMFIGTMNQWLVHVTHNDQDSVSYYTNVVFYIMLSAPVFSIMIGSLVDYIQHRTGKDKNVLCVKMVSTAIPLYITSVLGCCLAVFLAAENVSLLYLVFLLAVSYRALLFSSISIFLRNTYPSECFGFLYSVVMICIGVTMTLQFPLFIWCQSSDSGYSHNYLFLASLCLLSLIHPVFITVIGVRSADKTSLMTQDCL